jgi:hypothetical protein
VSALAISSLNWNRHSPFPVTHKNRKETESLKAATVKLLRDMEQFVESLRDFHRQLVDEAVNG